MKKKKKRKRKRRGDKKRGEIMRIADIFPVLLLIPKKIGTLFDC